MKWLHLTLIIFLSLLSLQGFSYPGENDGQLVGKNDDFIRISFIICIVMGVLTVGVQTYFKLFKIRFAIPIFVVLIIIGHPYNWMDALGEVGGLFEWSVYSLGSLTTIFVVMLLTARKSIIQQKLPHSSRKNSAK